MRIPVSTKYMKLFECLSSQTRIKILELLGEGSKNIGELANILNVSSAIMTRHIAMLENSQLVTSESVPGKRGLQKICSLAADEITLTFHKELQTGKFNEVSIPIGQYVAYEVTPTCGLASTENFIGICDDPRYFSDPSHVKAALLWFQSGFVEYRIPGYIIPPQPINTINISLEICSEFPGYKEDWPSDINFYLNNVLIGTWTSPGDFGDKKGTYTPDWWKSGTQYGLLKTIQITDNGSMIDGVYLSVTSLSDIVIEPGKDMSFRIEVPNSTTHTGGMNLFGKGFGNYDQNIEVRVEYK